MVTFPHSLFQDHLLHFVYFYKHVGNDTKYLILRYQLPFSSTGSKLPDLGLTLHRFSNLTSDERIVPYKRRASRVPRIPWALPGWLGDDGHSS